MWSLYACRAQRRLPDEGKHAAFPQLFPIGRFAADVPARRVGAPCGGCRKKPFHRLSKILSMTFATPSFSLVSVTRSAAFFTSSGALPMATPSPAAFSMSISL